MDNRNLALDGLRGVAAVVVVAYHFASVFLPGLFGSLTEITDSPLGVLFNGPFAVIVFFVLSGYVVSASAAKRRHPVWLSVALRYVRLGLPAAASALFAWGLLSIFPGGPDNLVNLLGDNIARPWMYPDNAPGPLGAIYEGGVQVFVSGFSGFNAVLWTMKAELIGSVLIYLVYGLTSGGRKWLTMAALACVPLIFRDLFYYEAFLAGALLREFRHKLPSRYAAPAFGVGLLLGAGHFGVMERLGMPDLPSILLVGWKSSLWFLIGAVCVVYGALASPRIASALERPFAQLLGRLSFPIYLVHAPVLTAVVGGLYGSVPAPLLLLLGVALVGVSALAFEAGVERPVLALIRRAQTRRAMALA